MPERKIRVILEIVWDDHGKIDHPMRWDWEYLVEPAQLVDAKIIDHIGEGWPSEIH